MWGGFETQEGRRTVSLEKEKNRSGEENTRQREQREREEKKQHESRARDSLIHLFI